MLKKRWGYWLLYSALFSNIVLVPAEVLAGEQTTSNTILEQIELYNGEDVYPVGQVTSVSQLSDIKPTDWAFQALQSLVERYGCMAGYPDGSYRGDRALTRYEFAAGLNACLDRITELIAASTADLVTRNDLSILQALQEEFAGELAFLRGRVDVLEARITEVELNGFSTTTKLKGEVTFAVRTVLANEKAGGGNLDGNFVIDNRLSLNFNTSFTGRDSLKIGLDAVNTNALGTSITGTNMTRLAFQKNNRNQFDLGSFSYRVRASNKFRFNIDVRGGLLNVNVSNNFNRLFSHPITGAISRFGRFNPIFRQGLAGTGFSFVYSPSQFASLSLGYLARNADNPTEGNGLFNGSYAALAQLEIKPSNDLSLGVTYVRAFYPKRRLFLSGLTGSQLANAPFGNLTPTSADHLGFQASWKVSPRATISGWTGWSFATAKNNVGAVEKGDDATTFNWGVSFGFPDFGKEGSLLGFVIGNPPKVVRNEGGLEDKDTAWHLEGFYRFQLNDNIAINPGVLGIVNPEHDSDNDAIWVVLIRTIFKF